MTTPSDSLISADNPPTNPPLGAEHLAVRAIPAPAPAAPPPPPAPPPPRRSLGWSLLGLGLLLATGLSLAAWLLGEQGKSWGRSKDVITVKGVAEKALKADNGRWSVNVWVQAPTMAEALQKAKAARPAMEAYLQAKGFAKTEWEIGAENADKHMVPGPRDEHGNREEVQDGYYAQQTYRITSTALDKIQAAADGLVYEVSKGAPYRADSQPEYLVSNLEALKISLIGAATHNARQRAEEFAKNGQVGVGAMRSATQGTFSIRAAGSDGDDEGYGGSNDTSTVDKIARVVVTIDYQIAEK